MQAGVPARAASRFRPAGTGAMAIAALALCLLGAMPVYAEETPAETAAEEGELPSAEEIAAANRALEGDAWLLLEQGRIALEQGDRSLAIETLLKAREAAGREVYPEADLAIGDFWRGEGELEQAERSYRRALDDSRIAENLTGYKEYDYQQLRYVILARLGDLARLRENYGGMEEHYGAIAQADRDFTTGALAERIRTNYEESGLNKVLTLYRLESGFAVRAHAELGWLMYRSGRYEKATVHSLFAVTTILSIAVRELRRVDPQYAFSSVEQTLKDAYRRPNTKLYLEESEVWKVLYYLAAESYALGHQGRARETWQVLQRSRDSGLYQGLAAKQLQTPWVEPVLKEPDRR